MKTPTQPKSKNKSTATGHTEKKLNGSTAASNPKKTSVKKKPSAWSNLISSTPSHQWSVKDKPTDPQN
jgi:hypothetical protein